MKGKYMSVIWKTGVDSHVEAKKLCGYFTQQETPRKEKMS